MNPMMIPFVIYRRWLELIFQPINAPVKDVTPLKLVPKPTPYEG
ncbi:hypothetical protein [Rhodoplanes sp. Z2-YC6860]|nr:hypothetical protein [Rhodoplanes sp. Z2-YC6860]